MEKRFYMFTKTSEKWPLQLFDKDSLDAEPLEDLMDIKQSIIANNGLYYTNTNKDAAKKQFIYRSQITSIYGPYSVPTKESLKLEHVMSLNEAVTKWASISSVDTIRKAINANRFYEWEVRKSESIWLVTYGGIMRLFGPMDYTTTAEENILRVQVLDINKDDPEAFEKLKNGKVKWLDILEEKGEGSND